MSLVRVLRTAQVTLTHTFSVDEAATDASGSVTATLKRLDGTVVNSATAGHPGPVGQYTYTVPAQSLVDSLTLDWVGSVAGASVTARDYVEIVGGFLFGLAEARAMPPALDATKYPAATLSARRIEVEQECERICHTAFVPRFMRVALSGTGTAELAAPHADLRALRAVSVAGTAWSSPDVAAVTVTPSGVLVRPAGSFWPVGVQNLVFEYEYGRDYPPEEVRAAGMLRLRSKLTQGDTSVPYRAISFTAQDGGVYRLSTPSRERTGLPEVDAIYERYTQDLGGFA